MSHVVLRLLPVKPGTESVPGYGEAPKGGKSPDGGGGGMREPRLEIG